MRSRARVGRGRSAAMVMSTSGRLSARFEDSGDDAYSRGPGGRMHSAAPSAIKAPNSAASSLAPRGGRMISSTRRRRGKHSGSRPQLSKEQEAEVREAFHLFDADNSGTIEYAELKTAMRALGFAVKKADVLKILEKHDKDQSGAIDYSEFLDIMTERITNRDPMEELERAFALFDADGDGKISLRDLRKAAKEVGERPDDDELLSMIDEFDKVRGALRAHAATYVSLRADARVGRGEAAAGFGAPACVRRPRAALHARARPSPALHCRAHARSPARLTRSATHRTATARSARTSSAPSCPTSRRGWRSWSARRPLPSPRGRHSPGSPVINPAPSRTLDGRAPRRGATCRARLATLALETPLPRRAEGALRGVGGR